ncbi:MAG TPA: carboxypeptidase regulatory-like domain-containing protein [Acidimicrobiales bacterium]|nr:carboxypeptidase regulatory-like domain-containing protein [Acidimicrobiales bacterium]
MSTNGFGNRPSGPDGYGSGNGAGNGADNRAGNGHGPAPRPALALRVEPADVVPGVPAQVLLAVRNDSGVATDVRFDVAGLNPEWVTVPDVDGALAPGETRQASLILRLPAGYPASELRAALQARAVGPGTAVPVGRPASADIVLRVAETGLIDASMPEQVYGAFRGRFHVSVRNRGREPQAVELSGSSPVARVSWSTRRVRLEPGAETRVRASVASKRAFTGPVRRVPFAVKVKGRGAPVTLGGTFVQRPWLSALFLKAGAILTTVMIFAALGTFLVVKLTSTYSPSPTAVPAVKVPTVKVTVPKPKAPKVALTRPGQTTSTTNAGSTTSAGKGAPNGQGSAAGTAKTGTAKTGTAKTGTASTATTRAGTTSAGKANTGTAKTGTTTAGRAPASGAAGAKSGTAAASKTSSSTTSASTKTKTGAGSSSSAGQDVAISGQVTAANAGGVTVSVQPASLAQQPGGGAATGVNAASTSGLAATAGPVGKLPGSPGDPPGDPPDPPGPGGTGGGNGGPSGSSFSTSTIGSGFFTFPAEFPTPGNYLVTFSKPGYATQKFVVTATGAPVNLNVNLTPGAGSLSGEVVGPDGPLGGATVTITDGTVTVSARTPTEGRVGEWSMSGLTTPDTYLVTATAPGYAASTTLVTLGAGKSSSGVDLALKAGVASIVGTVASPGGPVGGINVTATNGTATQSVTTLTGARDLTGGVVGTYVIPNLSVQGPWTLTASGPGWITQTQRVALSGAAAARSGEVTANFRLSATTATVTGTVVSGDPAGIGGVGVVMTGKSGTYKTLTATAPNAGSYNLSNVLPGHYVLLFSLFGYQSESVEVNLSAGQVLAVAPLKMPSISASSQRKAVITGNVVNLSTGNAVTKGTVEVDGNPAFSVPLGNSGSYIVSGLDAGVHKVTVTAPGYEPASVAVDVAMDATAVAPLVLLAPLVALSGVITSNYGGTVAGAFVNLSPQLSTERCGAAANPSAAPTPLVAGPEGKGLGCRADANGDFRIAGLAHGTYNVTVQSPHAPGTPNPSAVCGPEQPAPCGYYDSWVPTSGTVTVLEGQNQVRNFAMDMDGRLQVGAVTPGLGGILGQVHVGITITGPFSPPSNSGPASSAASTSTSTSTSITSAGASTTSTTGAKVAGQVERAGRWRARDLAATAVTAAAATSGCPRTGQVTETLTAPNAPVLFQGLPAGVYDVCFGPAANSNGAPISTSPNPAVAQAGINSSGTYSAVMLPSGITVSGSLNYQVDGKTMPVSCKAAAGAACSPGNVTATWQYYDRGANPPILLTGTFITPVDSSGFFEFTNVPSGEQVASPTVNLQVNAGGFTPLNENNVAVPTCTSTETATAQTTSGAAANASTCVPGYFSNLSLTALASAVTGSVVLHTGATTTDTAAADLSGVAVTVQSANGTGTNVTASVNGSGQLVWHDPAAPQPGWAEPGSYDLTFSAAGYVSPPPVQVTVPINTSCTVQPCAAVNIGTVGLFEHPSVTVQAVNSSGTPVNGATFVLYDPATKPPTLVSSQIAAPGSNSVTFNGLSLHSQPSYNYQLEVFLNCEGTILSPFTVSYGQATDTATLQTTSCIQGKVSGVVEDLGAAGGPPDATGNLVSPLPGVTVSAGNGLSAITASDGSFAIFGSPTASTLGLPSGSYTLSVSSVAGYGTASVWDPALTTAMANPVTVVSGQSTTVGLVMVANDITVSGQVTDQATGNAIPGVSVSFQGSLPTSPATGGSCNSSAAPPAQPSKAVPITTSADGQFSVCLPPGSWAATFSQANFAQQKVSFALDVGAGSKTLNVQMTESLNMVSGLVSEVIGQYGPVPLTGLTAADITVDDDGPNFCGNAGQSTCPIAAAGLVIAAQGNGQYSVTGSGASATFLQPGENYSITFKVPGFQPFSQSVEFTQAAGFNFILSPTLDADTTTVVVDVRTTVGNQPIVGASVALTPPGQESPPQPCPGAVASTPYCNSGETQGATATGNDGAATFQNVPLGDYEIQVNGSAVAASVNTANFCDDLVAAAISGCTAVSSEGQLVNAGTVLLHQATSIVFTGELQTSSATSALTYAPAAGLSVNFYSGTSVSTGTLLNPNGAATTASDGTASQNVDQTGEYTAQMSYPGFATTTGTPIDVVTGEAVANGVVELPVTAWYTQPTGTSGYGPQWTLKAYFCALGNAPPDEPTCGPSNAGLTLSTANGPSGTFVVDAIDTPSFNGGSLLPGQSFVAVACEVALGSTCSAPASATVDSSGDPINGGTNPTALALPPAPAVPSPPTALAAATTTGSNAVSLTWAPPANDGGAPVTGYDVYEGTSSGGESTAAVCTTTGTTCTVNGLTTGTPYFFIVEATNIAGFSSPSNEARSVAGVNPPPAPTGLSASTETGSNSISLSWDAPESDGGGPITGYEVYEGTSSGGESTTTPACTATTELVCSVDGLTIGTKYYFFVEATNIAGSSGPSSEASAVAGVNPPSAPTGLSGSTTEGSGTVLLNWDAPESDGGSAITSYEVYDGTSPAGESTATPACTETTPLLACNVIGLTNGTKYYFIVEATNAAGSSVPSNEVAVIAGVVPPAAPAGLVVAGITVAAPGGAATVTLTWNASTDDGGSPITGYQVYDGTSAGGESTTTPACSSTGALICTVTGLNAGTMYYFVVEATNTVGSSGPSNEVSTTPPPPSLGLFVPGRAKPSAPVLLADVEELVPRARGPGV